MFYLLLIIILFKLNEVNTQVVVPTITLNTGHAIPVIGLVTYNGTIDSAKMIQIVKDALKIGYRHIDTAQYYKNEKEIGKAITESIADGIVKREDIFITSKIMPNIRTNRKRALNAVKSSLRALNTTYIDLYLVHWPFHDYTGAYKGLEDALDQKLVKSIGVSNFDVQLLTPFLKNVRVIPALNQIEINPRSVQTETIEFCKKNGIANTGYSPLGTGRLINHAKLVAIGKKHKKSSAQVMIRWQLQRGLVVIPKTFNKRRLTENLNVFDFKLTDSEMNTISNL